MFEDYLSETYILDYKNEAIAKLIKDKKYRSMDAYDCIREIYSFMRDDIKYGFSIKRVAKASEVLASKKGDSYAKAILFMALLRGSGIPARLHLYKFYKHMYFGLLDKKHLKKLSDEVDGYIVECYLDKEWISLDGIILDKGYIDGLTHYLGKREGAYIGYGLGVSQVDELNTDYNGKSTALRMKAITDDKGVYATPDEITNSGLKIGFLDTISINKRIKQIRGNRD